MWESYPNHLKTNGGNLFRPLSNSHIIKYLWLLFLVRCKGQAGKNRHEEPAFESLPALLTAWKPAWSMWKFLRPVKTQALSSHRDSKRFSIWHVLQFQDRPVILVLNLHGMLRGLREQRQHNETLDTGKRDASVAFLSMSSVKSCHIKSVDFCGKTQVCKCPQCVWEFQQLQINDWVVHWKSYTYGTG